MNAIRVPWILRDHGAKVEDHAPVAFAGNSRMLVDTGYMTKTATHRAASSGVLRENSARLCVAASVSVRAFRPALQQDEGSCARSLVALLALLTMGLRDSDGGKHEPGKNFDAPLETWNGSRLHHHRGICIEVIQ